MHVLILLIISWKESNFILEKKKEAEAKEGNVISSTQFYYAVYKPTNLIRRIGFGHLKLFFFFFNLLSLSFEFYCFLILHCYLLLWKVCDCIKIAVEMVCGPKGYFFFLLHFISSNCCLHKNCNAFAAC